MKIIAIKDEDVINYKKISMFIALPYCSGKCWKELGLDCSICQNDELRKEPILDIPIQTIIDRYTSNLLSEAIVFGGMEPLDSYEELVQFISEFRATGRYDDIVIYSGYREDEVKDKINVLSRWENIIIKYGRYIPKKDKRFDPILGVELISDNQYAVKIN